MRVPTLCRVNVQKIFGKPSPFLDLIFHPSPKLIPKLPHCSSTGWNSCSRIQNSTTSSTSANKLPLLLAFTSCYISVLWRPLILSILPTFESLTTVLLKIHYSTSLPKPCFLGYLILFLVTIFHSPPWSLSLIPRICHLP